MDFGEKSKVMEVLNRAFVGSVVDKHVASAAIREFEGKVRCLFNVFIDLNYFILWLCFLDN